MRPMAHRFLSVALASVFLISVNANASSVTGLAVVLPNSYYLQPDGDGQIKLLKHDSGRVMPGTIAAYAVSGQLVMGAIGTIPPATLEHPYNNDVPFTGTAATRYFILDTRSGKLEIGLNEAAWHKRLEDLGVPAGLVLFPPLRWKS